MNIKESTREDFSYIKSLMLKALQEDNSAFSVTYDEYALNSEFWWQSYIDPFLYGYSQKMYIAFEENEPIGMIGIVYESKIKKKHIASVVWFYVKKEHRGKGFGKKLVAHLIESNKNKDLIKFSLLVNEPQNEAIQIYKKFGFEENGRLKKELRVNDKFSDVIIMEFFL